jgi:hypothetical protein
MVTGWAIEWSGFESKWDKIIRFFILFRQTQDTTEPATYWIREAISMQVKRQGREADRSPLAGVEVKKTRAYFPLRKYCVVHS